MQCRRCIDKGTERDALVVHVKTMNERIMTKHIYKTSISRQVGKSWPRQTYHGHNVEVLNKGQAKGGLNWQTCLKALIWRSKWVKVIASEHPQHLEKGMKYRYECISGRDLCLWRTRLGRQHHLFYMCHSGLKSTESKHIHRQET